ncbi:MAG: T9SS type A sorting domain-containing protein [Vicingaceae bacterium]
MTKKLLAAILFFGLLSSLSAQNWRPINPNHKVSHYLLADSIEINTFNQSFYFRPIQSVVIDQSYVTQSDTVLIFKKGYSLANIKELAPNCQNCYFNKEGLKGKVFGDTMILNTQECRVRTTDTLGFNLVFPATLFLNKVWELGRSSQNILEATVTQKRLQSIQGLGMDSVAEISIIVKNLNQQTQSGHPFNGTILLSKNHGMLVGFDFTDRNRKAELAYYHWDRDSINMNEIYQETVGDEIWYSDSSQMCCKPPSASIRVHQLSVISDQSSGNSRTLQYRTSSQRTASLNNSPFTTYPIEVDTLERSFRKDSLYALPYSCILEDSLIIPWNTYLNLTQFGVRTDWPEQVIEIGSNEFVLTNNGDSLSFDPLMFGTKYSARYLVVGVEPESYENITNPQLQIGGHYKTFFHYFQIGNKVLGNRPLLVSTDPLTLKNSELKLYPNPTSETLFLSNIQNFTGIRVYDQNGRLVKQWNKAKNKLDVSNLPNGLYFINLQTQSGELINRKFIKQ